ncbi:hypothetical protein Y032_0016g3101 [Ancylostoma ceylanicum]|uniref:Uncharacterized protein n=1 Tax=Ancylostoma ceylanicum TaxID=53326 RepID=A0A016V743_9BILA|nr:hypothetical protein Y032_0016g3101 [Ancylostoma ceylanicum]
MKPTFIVDEKWCLNVNIKCIAPWVDQDEQHEPQSNAGLHPLEDMISVWCDCIIHCEVLPRYTAITVGLYCQRLYRLVAKIAGRRPNYGTIRFLHDPARPLIIIVIRQKLLDLGWEVLTSPPYRSGLAPKDYQLLLTLSNALQGKACDDDDDLSSRFFESMPAHFHAEGIETLPGNWQRVTVRDGYLFIS